MRRSLSALFLTLAAGTSLAGVAKAAPATEDPYLWLEDVSGSRAMDWVNSHNAKSTAVLEADPRYKAYYDQALAIAQAQDRIPFGRFLNGQIYNFWQDETHVRG